MDQRTVGADLAWSAGVAWEQPAGDGAVSGARGRVVAFVCSLAIDWIGATATYKVQENRNVMSVYGAAITVDGGNATLVAGGNVTGLDLMGLVYGLGTLGLVTLGFTVLSRPDLALRLRMAVAGLGIGRPRGGRRGGDQGCPSLLIVNGSFASAGPWTISSGRTSRASSARWRRRCSR
jgi:hypothetical protein